MNPIRTLLPCVVGLSLAVVIAGCYPGSGDFTTEETDIVATVYDTTANFSANQTFVVPDTIVHIEDPDAEDPVDITRAHDDLILNTVRENMRALGYTEKPNASPADPPDLIVTVSATKTRYVGYVYDPWWGYWGWYGWWGPGWYPSYPCCSYVYTYETGTIFLDMVDVSESVSEEINIPWNAGINGMLSTGTSPARITARLDQAFEQSPYLEVQ